jgi:putative salt-induced outer membrane protein YdiY
MQLKRRCLVFAVLCFAVRVASAHSAEGPTLLPPPEAGSQYPTTDAPAADETLPTPELPATDEGSLLIEPDDMLVEESSTWYHPRYWFDPLPWDTGLELGINGSSGNNESFSIRAGGYIKRESRFSKLDLSSYHNRTNTGGEATQNNAQFDVRNDWLLDETSPWTLFATTNVFYDDFQVFDVQTNANMGVGYRFVHEPELGLIGRLGAGTSREFGGPDDRWVPESLVGFEYSQKLSTTQKLTCKLDYFPDWDEVGEYRMVADAGWEIELVQPSNMSLKISANDRYDSTPNGADPQLVNYSVLLLLKL